MSCGITNITGCLASAAAKAFEYMVHAFGEAVVHVVKFLCTFWMNVPSPVVAGGNGSAWTESGTLSWIHGALGPFVGFFGIISFVVGIGRIAWQAHQSGQMHETRGLVRQLAAVAAGSLGITAATQLLVSAGDKFSPWIVAKASGGNAAHGLQVLLTVGFGSGSPTALLGLWLIIFLLALLGSIAQVVFMFVRGAALVVLLALTPAFAATTASEEGWQRFKRLGMLLLGFVLYKPVAAIIYAVGIKLLDENTTASGHAPGGNVQNALYGMTILAMAALALPAFIKFVAPAAAAGSSSMFSGGAAVGAVAAGAAIVAGGAGGAAGAGAGAAGSGSGQGGPSMATGNQEPAAATNTGGGGDTGGGPTGGGGSGGPDGNTGPNGSGGSGGGGSGGGGSGGDGSDRAGGTGRADGGGQPAASGASGSRGGGRGRGLVQGGAHATQRVTQQMNSGEESESTTAEGADPRGRT